MNHRGFMLFELMIVISVVVICCSIGFLSFYSFKSSFHSQAALISLLFHAASTRAVLQKKAQEIIFDEHEHCMKFDNQTYPLDNFRFGVLPGVYGPPSKPSHPVACAITFVDKKLVCNPDGTMQSGTLYITDAAREQQYAFSTPVSAFAHIRTYKYVSSSWHAY